MGGTSAGLAILGDYDFAALNGSITSSEALADPYDKRITLDGGFVNERDYRATTSSQARNPCPSSPLALLNDTITDSHFQRRDRMGRLITFLARLRRGWHGSGCGAAASRSTNRRHCLSNRTARVVWLEIRTAEKLAVSEQQRSVYFLDTDTVASTPLSVPLNYANVQIVRASYDPKLGTSDTFNLEDWSGKSGSGVTYSICAIQGSVTSTQSGGLIY